MKRRHSIAGTGLKLLADDVARLSRLLTREREDLPADYLRDPGLRRAYLAYYLPANLAKVHLPLRELSLHRRGFPGQGTLRVLDIGTGPGTAVLGTLSFFATCSPLRSLEFLAVDRIDRNLRDAEDRFREHAASYGAPATLRTIVSDGEDLGRRLQGAFDLIIFANVLNEIAAGAEDRIARRIALLDGLLRSALADGGSIIIIEPALRATGRELLAVRDGLRDRGSHIFSPCLSQDHCPALADPKDWCHEERPWDVPASVRDLDSLTGLRKDAIKFAYVVLRRDAVSLADVYGSGSFRVVSEPIVSKGKRELYLCGAGRRTRAIRLDKDRAGGNIPFDDLRRGDIVRFEDLLHEDARFRISKGTHVMPVQAFR